MNRLFILHTPFHLFQAEIIISNSNSKIEKSSFNYLCTDKENILKLAEELDLFDEVYQLEDISKRAIGRKTYRKAKKNISIVKKILIETGAEIFLSDISYQINNLFYSDDDLQKLSSFNLISDGLLSFVDFKHDKLKHLKDALKRVLSIFHLSYKSKIVRGHISGCESRNIKKIYCFAPEKTIFPKEKCIEIFFNKEMKVDNSKILFLGQPYEEFFGEDWFDFLKKSVNELLKYSNSNFIFYKRHHRENKLNFENVFHSFGVKLFEEENCIEKVVGEAGFGTVISFNSSALIQLKILYPEINVISLFNDEVSLRIKKHLGGYKNPSFLFKKFGVEEIRYEK